MCYSGLQLIRCIEVIDYVAQYSLKEQFTQSSTHHLAGWNVGEFCELQIFLNNWRRWRLKTAWKKIIINNKMAANSLPGVLQVSGKQRSLIDLKRWSHLATKLKALAHNKSEVDAQAQIYKNITSFEISLGSLGFRGLGLHQTSYKQPFCAVSKKVRLLQLFRKMLQLLFGCFTDNETTPDLSFNFRFE